MYAHSRPQLCINESYCDGVESCHLESGCVVGTSIDCDDGVFCTVDACDEETQSCTQEPDDALCDNGLRCDGVEVCDTQEGCQSPVPNVCDDGVDCTVDRCEDDTGECLHEPDDTYCSNGVFCDGAETCDVLLGCVSAVSPCGDTLCDEAGRRCVECLEDAGCDDGVECTQDNCDRESGDCDFAPDDTLCDDLDACTTDRCETAGCVLEPITGCCTDDAQCADGNPCTDDLCDAGQCVIHNNNVACDDGDACTTNDLCAGSACAGTPIPNCGGDSEPPDGPEPSDADGDRVDDDLDACPNTPAGEAVDDAGCACAQRDEDGDGVADCADQCPNTEVAVTVDSAGCLLDPEPEQPGPSDEPPGNTLADADSDGVPDGIDLCPDSPTDTDVDADGCPIVADEPAGAGVGRRSVCGVCGPVGLIPWIIAVMGMGLMRTRRRH